MSDEIKLPSPEIVEQVMLEKEKAYEPHLLDSHAAFCHLYSGRLDTFLDSLSKKAILRVVKLAYKYPIQETDKKFQTEIEKNAFNILNQFLESKYTMMIHIMQEEAIKAMEKEKEDGKPSQSENS